MTLSSAKIVGILGLLIILTNSGVAWALQRCFTDNESGDHIHSAQTASAPAASNGAYSSRVVAVEHRHQPPSRIHCSETQILKLDFGPASSVFRLDSPTDSGVKVFLTAALSNIAATSNASLPESIYLSVKSHLSPHSLIPKLRI